MLQEHKIFATHPFFSTIFLSLTSNRWTKIYKKHLLLLIYKTYINKVIIWTAELLKVSNRSAIESNLM